MPISEDSSFEPVERWKHVSYEKCMHVCQYISKLCQFGVPLPEGKKPEDLLETTEGELFGYAVRLYENDALWEALPERLQLPPDVRKELILQAKCIASALSEGERIDIDETLSVHDDEYSASFEAFQTHVRNEFTGDDAELAEMLEAFKQMLWTKRTKAELRNELHSLLKECC